ncbi:hypothetical protein BJ546DRAFT_1061976 [Cryomyces antarcticus]|nr:hypothetical protein LTR39_006350 [Cryomyces antarcticus]
MGNLCGKQSSSEDAFSQPGRTLGSAPARPVNASASVPPRIHSQSQGRTLGGSNSGPGVSADDDPRTAAARAAEDRARRAQGKGKLGRALDARRAQTQAATLEASSRATRGARDADAAAEARAYN